MSDATEQALTRAYELIEADQPGEAEELLKPILAQEADNADAWWLYAHAVSDPETARMALNQVLKLDSNYEGAQELLDQLDELKPAQGTLSERATFVMGPPPNLPEDEDIESPEFLADLDDAKPSPAFALDDDFSLDDVEEADSRAGSPQRSSRLPALLLTLLLLALVIVVILLVLNPFGIGSGVPTPTQDGQQVAAVSPTNEQLVGTTPTSEGAAEETDEAVVTVNTPTAEGESQATDEVATEEGTIEAEAAGLEQSVQALLADFELASDNPVSFANTDLGNTLVASVCSANGDAALRETLERAMPVLAQAHSQIGEDVQAIGVRLVDCTNNNVTLRVIAVPAALAADYNSDSITEEEYRAGWVAAA